MDVSGGRFIDVMLGKLNETLNNKGFGVVNMHTAYQGEILRTDQFIPYDEIEQNLFQVKQ